MSMVSIIRFVIFQITASTIPISMNQVLALVCDNASNNDTMVEELQVLVPSFRGQTTRVRCFAHILNLVVKVRCVTRTYCSHVLISLQAILSQFSQNMKASDDEEDEEHDADLFKNLSDEEEEEDDADAEPQLDDDEVDPIVDVSDAAMIQEVIAGVGYGDRIPMLSRTKINVGRFSVFKVSFITSVAIIMQ
jgi:hypothetical protein